MEVRSVTDDCDEDTTEQLQYYDYGEDTFTGGYCLKNNHVCAGWDPRGKEQVLGDVDLRKLRGIQRCN